MLISFRRNEHDFTVVTAFSVTPFAIAQPASSIADSCGNRRRRFLTFHLTGWENTFPAGQGVFPDFLLLSGETP
jgi:hypothetical protein